MPRRNYTLLQVALLLLCSSLIEVGDAVQLPLSLGSPSPSEDLVLRQLKRFRDSEAGAGQNPVYSYDWAVQVYGGDEAADELAAMHGFINMGKVVNLAT